MSIVLSHRTGWLVWHAPDRPRVLEPLPVERSALTSTYPAVCELDRVRLVLRRLGIPVSELGHIDVLVSAAGLRSSSPAVSSHVCTLSLPPYALRKLAPGIFVVCPELSFIQMAHAGADWRELVEYGFELCGGYEMPIETGAVYRERLALTSIDRIRSFLKAMPGVHGARAARSALCSVRDGARSPMETADIMMLVLPKRRGGLGLYGLQVNYRIPIPNHLRSLTTRGSVVCDCCVPRFMLDEEYNGFYHDDPLRKVADEERRCVLEAMGYRVRVLTKEAFFNRNAYRRHVLSIMSLAGIDGEQLDADFWRKHEELRCFVLRRWLHDDTD